MKGFTFYSSYLRNS